MSISNKLWKQIDPFRGLYGVCTTAISAMFTLLPDGFFDDVKIFSCFSDYVNTICVRGILAGLMFFAIWGIFKILRRFCRSRLIEGRNYSVEVQYGSLFDKENKGKIVISFDECFTTLVDGNDPGAINPKSVCGQFLRMNALDDSKIQSLIQNVDLKPMGTCSNYREKTRFETGSIVPMERWLLLAFSKLDKDGLARMNYSDYIQTLSKLWKELDKYYGQEDVYIPILGAGVTRIDGYDYSKQELLDIIINTYRLSPYKLKLPNRLHIVCDTASKVSLERIGESV